MEVEGVHLPSGDTEMGNQIHRHVNKASKTKSCSAEDDNKPGVLRSLTLTSEARLLTATIDLTEIDGSHAIPIEYRKGKPHYKGPSSEQDDNKGKEDKYGPWPTDIVQLGLQSLLLIEAGYMVNTARVYYSTANRTININVDDDVLQKAIATFESARLCAVGTRPLPLLNDPRCPKCSLNAVCLPDEINYYSQRKGAIVNPRRVWPPHNDGIQVVVQSEGTKVGVSGQALKFTNKGGLVVKEMPLNDIDSLAVIGNAQVTTQAVQALAGNGTTVAYLSAAGRILAFVDPLDMSSANIRKAQVLKLNEPDACLEIASTLISAKIANQRTLLMRNNKSVSKADKMSLKKLVSKAQNAKNADSLRGYEGSAASIYFGNMHEMLSGALADEFKKNGRKRRPPPDPVNACLSFAYTLLNYECVSALRLARLDPSIGAYHVYRPGRPALALDLMEPFRPLIADSITLSAFNRRELTEKHFIQTAAGCVFTNVGRKIFFSVYARRMDTEITHPVYDYRLSYRRMLMLHAKMMAAWFSGEIPSLSFLTTR